ncbi:MAG: tetratricopeptide repeat protein [Candidatus Heimdallarchaeota archaeon]
MLPKSFSLHENRISREGLEAIEFQFERLGLDGSDNKIFLERILRISQSPTLPPEDFEICYLSSKAAYMLSSYDYFETEVFLEKCKNSDGARIWFALAKTAQGEVEEAIKVLEDVKTLNVATEDHLQYIESLGILAQIYFIRGTKSKKKLEDTMEKIDKFKEKHCDSLPDFDHLFMPAYLITERINSQINPPGEVINEIEPLYEKAKKLEDKYWLTHFALDLVQINIALHKPDVANKYLTEVFETLQDVSFKALEAKAIRIQGQLFDENKNFAQAETNFLKAKLAYEKLHDQIGVSDCVSRLAKLAYKQNDNEKAEQYFTESYTLSDGMNDFVGKSVALEALARLAYLKGQYAEALGSYKKVYELADKNNLEFLMPTIYDGLAYVNFISGDFKSAVKNRAKAADYKERYAYSEDELLIEKVKLGQLYAIVGELEESFNQFETALNYCMKIKKKDDVYFDILNWLFEISTAIGKYNLAETYVSRADLFASIHGSEEENVQAVISNIRFLIMKKELDKAETTLDSIMEQAQEFPSPLVMSLALVEKSSILLLKYLESGKEQNIEDAIQNIEDMLFISLDLEFLPLTMYSKKVLAKVLLYKYNFKDGKEELMEAVELAEELGMQKFEDTLRNDIKAIEKIEKIIEDTENTKVTIKRDEFIKQAIDFLKETFWLVSASEYQKI